jgi:rhodanese-related sulfurtransferase
MSRSRARLALAALTTSSRVGSTTRCASSRHRFASAWAAAGYDLFQDVNSYAKAFGELVEHRRHTPSLPADDVAALIASGADVAVLDVRRFDEYATMNIPGSVSVPGAELVLRAAQAAAEVTAKALADAVLTAKGADVLTIYRSADVTLEGFTLVGDYAMRGQKCVTVAGLEGGAFRDLTVRDAGNTGIYSNGVFTDITMSGWRISHCGDFGVAFQNGGDRVVVEDCVIFDIASILHPGHGIYARSSSHVTVKDCEVWGVKHLSGNGDGGRAARNVLHSALKAGEVFGADMVERAALDRVKKPGKSGERVGRARRDCGQAQAHAGALAVPPGASTFLQPRHRAVDGHLFRAAARPRFGSEGYAMKHLPPLPSVPDHAVIRYLERAKGVDIEAIRRHIAGLVKRGVAANGGAVVVEGVKFVLRDNVVVTIGDRRWQLQKREAGDA